MQVFNILVFFYSKGGFILIFSTNKQKGNTALGIAIAYFSINGYTVSIPLNDTQDYDLIAEKIIYYNLFKLNQVDV